MERFDRRRTAFTTGLVVVLSTFIACGSAFELERETEEARPAAPPPVAPLFERGAASIADVSERSVPSVVNISTTKKSRMLRSPYSQDPFFRHFFRQMPQRPPSEQLERSRGSGVIVRADGVVLTNNHVVDGADGVTVTLHDGRAFDAEIVGTDPPSDLAVLKLKDPPKELQALPFGDSDALRLGEVVVAIGNPFGVGQTVTMGIVSAKGRANVGIVDYEDFIQTDAAINPGNSGGALLNLRGELVGINTAILSRSGGYQGIGFAVPTNMAGSIMEGLLEHGKVVRGYLGVMIQDLTTDLANAMNVDAKSGVVVSEVMDDSPAERAGIESGDVILSVDGREVATSAKLRNLVAAMGGGRRTELEIVRDGTKRTITVELGEKGGDGEPSAIGDGEVDGLTVEPLTDTLRQRFGVADRIRSGVVVMRPPTGAAAKADLRVGDVILEVAGQPVSSPSEFERLFEKTSGPVLLRIHRRGASSFVAVDR